MNNSDSMLGERSEFDVGACFFLWVAKTATKTRVQQKTVTIRKKSNKRTNKSTKKAPTKRISQLISWDPWMDSSFHGEAAAENTGDHPRGDPDGLVVATISHATPSKLWRMVVVNGCDYH